MPEQTNPVKFGIDNLKKLLHFIFSMTAQAYKVTEDGKVKLMELFGFVDELMEVPGVIKAIPLLKNEFRDLDEAEKADLIAYIKENFDIPDDRIEVMIETALEAGINFMGLIDHWKAIKQ